MNSDTPIAALVESMLAAGAEPESIVRAVKTAELHARASSKPASGATRP
jgi:hypothetical protein